LALAKILAFKLDVHCGSLYHEDAMKTLTEVKNELLEALTAVVDEPLRQVGFVRKKGSLTYSRMLNAAKQQITFVMDCFPKYQPGAEAHIHPMLSLRMPEVNEKALALVNGNKMLLADAPEIIVNQPIEFSAPREKHQRWFATGNEQFVAACDSIQAFLDRWVLPFLAEVSTPADLIKLYETNDARMMKQKHWHIFIAAAYQVLDQLDKARKVVRQEFGSPGLRKRYAPLFVSLAIQ
jgi:hypothetical protein